MEFSQGKRTRSTRGRRSQQEEDPERQFQLKKICDILMAGGYFRARIASLSPFDRVVGGLVWCITASNVAVDVDIIFKENATIGERIELADTIVRALVKMKCPQVLHSHQIQGLDYPPLFAVIQWLVRHVIEYRLEVGNVIRQQAEAHFGKDYTLPQDVHTERARGWVSSVRTRYQPKRRFRRKHRADFVADSARVEATLLEYGEKLFRPQFDVPGRKKTRQSRLASKHGRILQKLGGTAAEEHGEDKEAKAQEAAEEEKKRIAAMQSQLSEIEREGVSGAHVEKLVDMAAIQEHEEEHQEEIKRLEQLGGGAKAGVLTFQRQREGFQKQIAAKEAELAQAQQRRDAVVDAVRGLHGGVEEAARYKEKIERETQALELKEQEAGNKPVLARLRDLVMLNENLKTQRDQFKEACKRQLAELQNQLASLENIEGDEETARMLEVERVHKQDSDKFNQMRQVLAQKNQAIAAIVRNIDSIPTRAELIQYERRFVELYELVSEKLVETRRYFALYNTLKDSHQYMSNEVSLLNSIADNYSVSMQTRRGKEAFLTSFRSMLEDVEQSIQQLEADEATELKARDASLKKHKKLLEKQRKYFKMVKQFQEQCHMNELLLQRLEEVAPERAREE